MKPKLTDTVRRGMKHIAILAGADLDADQSTEFPRFTEREASEIRRALRWIDHLDEACKIATEPVEGCATGR